jgi:myo-inositol-1(or 4)-monophosphatase
LNPLSNFGDRKQEPIMRTTDHDVPDLAGLLARTVREVMAEVRPRLIRSALSGNREENENLRHEDNFLSDHDLWMHERYKELLADSLDSFVYASEEADPEVVGRDGDPDLCVLVDPLDTSELAVRALNGYTHVLAYSRALRRPVAAVIGDIYHHVQLYVAGRDIEGNDKAYVVTRDDDWFPLSCRPARPIAECLVTNYLMRPQERFLPLSQRHDFLKALGAKSSDGKYRGRIGVDFGSVSLCHVAAGFTDVTIEFAKGFAIWDLSPGHYVLSAAGGSVVDLFGEPLSLDYGLRSLDDIAEAMRTRQTFVAAGSIERAREIATLLT